MHKRGTISSLPTAAAGQPTLEHKRETGVVSHVM